MSKAKAILFELGTEELPPKALKKLAQQLAGNLTQLLDKAELSHASVKYYASPRRLAVLIEAVDVKQADQDIERLGPALQAAFDKNDTPTPAAEGFAKSCGTTVDQLQQKDTPKGVRLSYTVHQTGATTTELLPDLISQAVNRLAIPKPMRWANHDYQFIRPVHWLVLLFGDEVVPMTLFGKQAGNRSYGHRFHHPGPITIPHPRDYCQLLKSEGKVIVDLDERKNLIREQAQELAATHQGRAVITDELLDEVNAIVAWPEALAASFDKHFLELPSECLQSAMQSHQKCFPVVDDANNLLPLFITVSNICSTDAARVVAGNERVMRARLADADFFYRADLKVNLSARQEQLKSILYQAKLGTMHDKADRIGQLAKHIAEQVGVPGPTAQQAGELCKCDLASDMVGEFPELQGTMGYYYALAEGLPEDIAIAIRDHYSIPSTPLGCCVAIADKLDSLICNFAIGQVPTGDKDPYGLRRAALGILHTILQAQLNLDLSKLIAYADSLLDVDTNKSDSQEALLNFFFDRLKYLYHEKGYSFEQIAAVQANRPTQPLDFERRLLAVKAFSALPEAEQLAAANKRVGRILHKENITTMSAAIDSTLLIEPAEQALATALTEQHQQLTPLLEQHEYTKILSSLASLQSNIDRFFDEVMVNTEDKAVRQNRLNLLVDLHTLFLTVADISLLSQS